MASDQHLGPGAVLDGEFEIVSRLARGGMGTVYVARRRSTDARCAVKVMHPELVKEARSRARFTREAELCAHIESDHVVRVLASGIDEATETPWIAMELVDGIDLEKLSRKRGAWPVEEAREVLRQLFAGVGAAHRTGVVHRDLKPQNVLLTERVEGEPPRLKVLDFGISKQSQEDGTDTTAAVGSPLWMAPEQAKPGRLTPATDVFALALLTFRVLTGWSYWRSAAQARPTLKETLQELLMKPYVPASARAAELGGVAPPPGFDAWFDRAAHRDPTKRFHDADAAWAALAPLLEPVVASPAPADDAAPDAAPGAPTDAPSPQVEPATPRASLPPAVDEDATATVAMPDRDVRRNPVQTPSKLRSPTPMPLPELLDAARAARPTPPERSLAFKVTVTFVGVVLLVALAVLLTRRA